MAYNKIILEGNLSRDIEIKYSQSGSAIANTAIAVSKKFKKQDGSQGEEVLFVDLTFFSRNAEIANQYLRKGSKVLVDGRLKLDQWDDKQSGQKRSKHSVTVENLQMLGSKDDNQQGGYASPDANAQREAAKSNYSQPAPSQPPAQVPEIDINEDEIPF